MDKHKQHIKLRQICILTTIRASICKYNQLTKSPERKK